ncbi:MAG TPA: oligosaccharide flippase family protein [Gemmatimonadales bacterium]
MARNKLYRLTSSFASLAAVQVSTNLASLVTVPFLSRVLGPASWGALVLAQAIRMVTWPLVEYGFTYSATRDIALDTSRPQDQQAVIGRVLGVQIVLSVASGAVILAIWWLVGPAHLDFRLLAFAWIGAVFSGTLPWWYFQSLGGLWAPALTTVAARWLAVVALFIVVGGPQDTWIVLALDALAAGSAVFVSFSVVRKRAGALPLHLGWLSRDLREGWHVFTYRFAERVQDPVTTLAVGAISGPVPAGFFGGLEKIIKLLRSVTQSAMRAALGVQVSEPLVLVQSRRQLWQGLWPTIAVGFAGALVLFLGRHLITSALLGPEFAPVADLIGIGAVLVPLILVTAFVVTTVLIPAGADSGVGAATVRSTLALALAAAALIPPFGAPGAVIALIIAETVRSVLLVRQAERHLEGAVAGAA